jgi:hypothetical protein
MSRLARVASLSLVACLLAGASLPAQAQDTSRARPRPAPSAPPAPKDEKGASLDEANRISGIRTHLTYVRSHMKQILDEDLRLDFDARRWLAQTIDSAFSPEAYTKPIRQALLDNYNADALARVLIWYRSPIGKKMVRLEQAGAAPGQLQARSKYLATLENKQPSEDRLVLIFRIDEASHLSEATFAADKALTNGWNLGIQQVLSATEQREVTQTQLALDVFRAQLRDVVSEGILREMMYVYRDATDAELRGYAEFLESDAGAWFFNTVYKGQQAVVEKAADKVAEEFVRSVQQRQTTRPPYAPGKIAPIAPLPIPPGVRRPPPA